MAKRNRKPSRARPSQTADKIARRGKSIAIGLALIAAAICVADGRVLRNPFVWWDDQVMIYENPDLNPPTAAGLVRYWGQLHAHLYMPVTYTVWWALAAATWQAAGLNPAVFHGASIVLHVLSAWIVMMILLWLVDSVPAACAGALLFALHPVQVETIAWASGLKDLLSGALSLAALGSYLLFRRSTSQAARRIWVGLATLAFVLAMLAKPNAVIVPLLIVAVDWLVDRRFSRQALYVAAIWLLLAMPILVVARHVQATAGNVPSLWQRPIVAVDTLGFYLQKLVWPAPLAIDYGRTPDVALAAPWRYTLVAVAGAAIIALAARLRPEVAVGAAIGVAALLPYLGLMPFEYQQYSTVTDHYLYLAMLGPAVALAYLLCGASWPWWTACGAALALFATLSFQQVGTWGDSRTLFEHAIAVNPDSVAAHHSLGIHFFKVNDLAAAEREYREALRVRPNEPEVNTSLGNLLAAQGHGAESLECYRRALQSTPHDVSKVNNLAMALAISGRYGEAEPLFRSALESESPYAAVLHGNLGMTLLNLGRTDEARAEFERALALDPDSGVARNGMQQLQALGK